MIGEPFAARFRALKASRKLDPHQPTRISFEMSEGPWRVDMTASSTTRRTDQKTGEQGASGFLLTAPAQAALLGLSAVENNLRIWRSVADSMRASIRSQQDAMLRMLLDRTAEGSTAEETEETRSNGELIANGASDLFTPVLAARRAYVQMSGAMIAAQREALAAFVRGASTH